jgi:nucleoside-diphosphate-sugar epimerase
VHKDLPLDDPQQRCPDISLAKKELEWHPKYDRNQGLKKTIEYFENILRKKN